ncbi:microtubule integrity protein mal3 [Blastocladiella emersonii ATCC 22665]|nr:microtubule integrity protein mal3 [Blastocladiella emersonii ATCC 22665]
MGESRVELLAWVNALLGLNYTKIEQLGTGAAYCQVFDSIWGDLQMHKVKYDARHEYEYVQNYKVLQLAFEQHKIDKAIPVERLIKCKFQDNIEFTQWAKRFHDMYYPGGYYDAAARRKAGPGGAARSKASMGGGSANSLHPNGNTRSAAHHPPTARSGSALSRPGSSHGHSAGSGASAAAMQALQRQVAELTQVNEEQVASLAALEKERDFYFGKLRDIEILIQQEAARGVQSDLITLTQQILYATDDGFEVPEDALPGDMMDGEYLGDQMLPPGEEDMETF